MKITVATPVREIVTQHPESVRTFEKFGIDYCCGGKLPLEQACKAKNIDAEEVLGAIDEVEEASRERRVPGWENQSLTTLVEHIIKQHHAFTRTEIARLVPLLAKVRDRHGKNAPHLKELEAVFHQLAAELTEHMMKEERVLFPYIVLRESGNRPKPAFGTIENPVRVMEAEHEHAAQLITEIKRLTSDFVPLENACPSYRGLYQGLQEFNEDLRLHVHLENNILFPRALAFESSAGECHHACASCKEMSQ